MPTLKKVEVLPGSRLLNEPVRWQQLSVQAHYSNGAVRDVTRLTVFSSSDPAIANVDANGGSDTAEETALQRRLFPWKRYNIHNLPATRAECFAAFFGYYALKAGFGTGGGGFSIPADAIEAVYQQTWIWCGLLP